MKLSNKQATLNPSYFPLQVPASLLLGSVNLNEPNATIISLALETKYNRLTEV